MGVSGTGRKGDGGMSRGLNIVGVTGMSSNDERPGFVLVMVQSSPIDF